MKLKISRSEQWYSCQCMECQLMRSIKNDCAWVNPEHDQNLIDVERFISDTYLINNGVQP